MNFTATIACFDTCELAELFLSNGRADSNADTAAREAAIAASLALQFGCPLEVLRSALLRDSHGRASGVLSTALDYISEHMS
jgi:ribonucleoside-diphosphate reductase alpha chain